MKLQINTKFIVKGFKIDHTDHDGHSLVQRLMDFGLYPGIEFQIVKTIPLSKVTVIQFYQTLLALNEQEFKCLDI